ncbi:Hypothetical protein CINCED_3A025010 [Cinara cedri]|nr:Hypothetical protein CINCED_3A025010 [Cinara cedri]
MFRKKKQPVQTKIFYIDLLSNPGLLKCTDTTNLPRDHPCYVAERKKIPGLFLDETDGRTITEFCALRAKSFAYKINGKEKIKAKVNSKTFLSLKAVLACNISSNRLTPHRRSQEQNTTHFWHRTVLTFFTG